jgi:hypothetical protein
VEQESRGPDFRENDVVVGAFLGDQDLLVLCPSEPAARRMLVALPLDAREDWHAVGASLSQFLESYLAHVGEKYWEVDAGP